MQANKAHRMWADSPLASRFGDPDPEIGVKPAIDLARSWRATSKEVDLDLARVEIVAEGDEIKLGLPSGRTVGLLPHAFDQICTRTEAPADFLRDLSTETALAVLRERFRDRQESMGKQQALVRSDDAGLALRDLAGLGYERTWTETVLTEIQEKLIGTGWRIPPARPAMSDPRARPATPRDVLAFARHANGLSINEGDMIAPAGCYVTESRTWCFLIKDEPMRGPAGKDLYPGIALSFGELYGSGAVKIDPFGLSGVCGNHLLADFISFGEARVIHRRGANASVTEAISDAMNLGDAQLSDRVMGSTSKLLSDKTETLIDDTFVRLRGKPTFSAITKKLLASATKVAIENEDKYGDPRSLWAIHSGLTEVSQKLDPASRWKVDQAAGRLLTIDV